jgi:glycosyltransferase involved in cell wall biosynthesis
MLYRPKMRVLHVVESLGGGVLSSVLAMVDATPDLDHHLAIWPRRVHADTGDQLAAFTSVRTLSSQPVRAVLGLRNLVHVLGPDQVHAHSSYAGLLARVVNLDVDVVYSPHCFAFERGDLGPVSRASVRRIEKALVRRTSVLVACSPREASLAGGLGHGQVVTVPNRALDPPDVRAHFSNRLRVVAVGRIGLQKDWRYLLAVKGHVETMLGTRVNWEWLGGGDVDAEHSLRRNGVAVAGWLPRREVVRRLGEAQVYVHTAAWEAAPISILEASAVGLPIAARGIDTLASLGVPGMAATVSDVATRIVDLHDATLWASEQQRSLAFAAGHSADLQRERLHAAYRHAPADFVLR